jgi:hypothetical protein
MRSPHWPAALLLAVTLLVTTAGQAGEGSKQCFF